MVPEAVKTAWASSIPPESWQQMGDEEYHAPHPLHSDRIVVAVAHDGVVLNATIPRGSELERVNDTVDRLHRSVRHQVALKHACELGEPIVSEGRTCAWCELMHE